MKKKLLLILAILAVSSIASADINHDFEQYTDDEAWITAGGGVGLRGGGWVETLDERDYEDTLWLENPTNFIDELDEFRLEGNPCMDRVNSSARCIHITSPENTNGATLTINFAAMPNGTFSFNIYSPAKSSPPNNYAGWVMGGANPTLFHGMFYEYLDQTTIQYGSQEPSGGYTSKNMGKLGSSWHVVEGNWNSSGRLNVWYDGVPYLTNAPMRAAIGSGVTYLQFTSAPTGTNGSDVYIDNIVVRSGVYSPSNANHTFEEFADNSAWLAAGRGGWTLTGQDEFIHTNNPLVNAANPSVKCLKINSASNTPSGTLRINIKPLTSGTFSFQVYTTAGSGPPYNYGGWTMGGVNPSLFHGMLYEYLNQATIQYGNVEPYGGYTSMNMGTMNATWHTIEGYWWKDSNNSGRLCVSMDGVTYINNAPMRNDISTGVSYFELSSAPTGTYASSVCVDNIVIREGAFESPLIYSNGAAAGQKIEMCIDSSAKYLSYIRFDNIGPTIHGGDGGLWRLYFIDAYCESLNSVADPNPRTDGCGVEWKMGNNYITSRDATLTSKSWNPTTKTLTLNYTHTKADVTWTAVFGMDTVEFNALVTNKTNDELQLVQIPDNWRLKYNTVDNFIMPENHNGIKYDFVHDFTWSQHSSAWDGFLVTTPTQYLGFFNVQPYTGYVLATQNALKSVDIDHYRAQGQVDRRIVSILGGTICYRTNTESVDSVNYSIGRYSSLRSYADAYLAANFTGQSTLYNKIKWATDTGSYYGTDDLYDKMAGAVLLGTNGHFETIEDAVADLPSKMIMHTYDHKHQNFVCRHLLHPNDGAECWFLRHPFDAFPNYFPPHTSFAMVPANAQAEHDAMVSAINNAGHIMMPRTSFFYWVNGGDADLDALWLADAAQKRIDGDAQKAAWGPVNVGQDGYIMSPFSTSALNLMRSNHYSSWLQKGATAYFSNVIAVLSPGYNRYDFHSDNGGRPDHFYHNIYENLVQWHGTRLPLLTEGGCSRQMPYQAGFCYSPAWKQLDGQLDTYYTDNWLHPRRGSNVCIMPEMNNFIGHEYLAYYAPNTNYEMTRCSQISFAVLHGMQFKYNINFDLGPDVDPQTGQHKLLIGAWRWVRTLATLGQKISTHLYGRRLVGFNRDVAANVHNAIYSRFNPKTQQNDGANDIVCWGNFSASGYAYGGETIAPDGFMFTSSDGKVFAGCLSSYNGQTLAANAILVIDKTESNKINVYTPDAEVPLPLKINLGGKTVSYVMAHYPDGTTTYLSYTVQQGNVNITAPVYADVSSSVLPYVEIALNP